MLQCGTGSGEARTRGKTQPWDSEVTRSQDRAQVGSWWSLLLTKLVPQKQPKFLMATTWPQLTPHPMHTEKPHNVLLPCGAVPHHIESGGGWWQWSSVRDKGVLPLRQGSERSALVAAGFPATTSPYTPAQWAPAWAEQTLWPYSDRINVALELGQSRSGKRHDHGLRLSWAIDTYTGSASDLCMCKEHICFSTPFLWCKSPHAGRGKNTH